MMPRAFKSVDSDSILGMSGKLETKFARRAHRVESVTSRGWSNGASVVRNETPPLQNTYSQSMFSKVKELSDDNGLTRFMPIIILFLAIFVIVVCTWVLDHSRTGRSTLAGGAGTSSSSGADLTRDNEQEPPALLFSEVVMLTSYRFYTGFL